jgi:cytochrome c553
MPHIGPKKKQSELDALTGGGLAAVAVDDPLPLEVRAGDSTALTMRVSCSDQRDRAGRLVFERTACINCHGVNGTVGNGRFGPDLTHLMSRATLGSGALTNSPEGLRAWIVFMQKFAGYPTNIDVEKALADKGIAIERRRIRLDDPIKALGEYPVTVHLSVGVDATVTMSSSNRLSTAILSRSANSTSRVITSSIFRSVKSR